MEQPNKSHYNETKIKVIDTSGDFIEYWKIEIAKHLPQKYLEINYGTTPPIPQLLTSININLYNYQPQQNQPEEQKETDIIDNENKEILTINVIRVNKEKNINEPLTSFRESYKPNHLVVLLLNVTESNDNAIKNCNELANKIKKDLGGLIDIFPMPYNKNTSGPISDQIENFIQVLNVKLCEEFNKILKYYSDFDKTSSQDKDTLENEDKFYNYLLHKYYYIQYLFLTGLYTEIELLVEKDLNKKFRPLAKQFPFTVPFSYIIFDCKQIQNRIKDKTLSHLEYQEYLFYIYLESCQKTKKLQKITQFINKIFYDLSQYNLQFKSMFHFYFWIYLYIRQLLYYIRSISLTAFKDVENVNIKIQINLLYYLKKILKNYSLIAKIEIPDHKIFMLTLSNQSQSEISNEMNSALTAINDEIENDDQYQLFIKETNDNFEEKAIHVFKYQKTFLEEYLGILLNVYNLHKKLKQKNFCIRILLEIIPIKFVLSKFDEVKNDIINLMEENELKDKKWSYIYEFLNFILMLLINCLAQSNDNLNIVLKYIDRKIVKIAKLIKIVNSDDINIIDNIISKYIDNFNLKLNNGEGNFIMNKIINISFGSKENQIECCNISKEKNTKITLYLSNNTGYNLNINKMKIVFIEKFTKDKVEYVINKENLNKMQKINPFEYNNIIELTISIEDTFKVNSTYILKELDFILKNNITGIYLIENNKSLELNIKSIETEVESTLTPSFDSEELIPNDTYLNPNEQFFFNTIANMIIKVKNIPKDMKDKRIIIEVIDKGDEENKKSIFKFATSFYINNKNVKVSSTVIEFIEGAFTYENSNEFKIPFIIEESNVNISCQKSLLIKFSILKEDTLIYSFTKLHSFNICHLFTIKEKFKLNKKTGKVLMQSSIKINLELGGVKVILPNNNNANIVTLSLNQSFNSVLFFSNDISLMQKELTQKYIQFIIKNEKNKFKFVYPVKYTLEEIKKFLNIPYYIMITIDEAEHKIFKEFAVNVHISKFCGNTSWILMKMKENENCSIIGKSKIIERMGEGKCEIDAKFKLFPMQDGYLKIPEVEFIEFKASEDNEEEIKEEELNFFELNQVRLNGIIEGNERIVKINAINTCTLRLNLT